MAQQNTSIKSQSSKQPFQRRQHRSLQTAGHAWNRSFLCLSTHEKEVSSILIGTGSQSRLSKLKSAQFQRGFRQSMAPHKMRLDSAHRRSAPWFHAAQGKSNPSEANESARIGGCLGKSNRSFSGKLFLLSKCAHLKSGTRLHLSSLHQKPGQLSLGRQRRAILGIGF